jgi:hypothetical protein
VDDLIKQIVDKTGISVEQAKTAAESVIAFIKAKLPTMGGDVDGLFSGQLPSMDDVKSKLGGLFGK